METDKKMIFKRLKLMKMIEKNYLQNTEIKHKVALFISWS